MKKTVILLIVLMMVSVGFLSGCNEQSDKDKFIGTWIFSLTYTTYTYTYFSDGTLTILTTYQGEIENSTSGTWKILDNKLVLTKAGKTNSYDYSFSDDGKTLTLLLEEHGNGIFTKQE